MSRPEGRVHSEIDSDISPQRKRVERRGSSLAARALALGGIALATLTMHDGISAREASDTDHGNGGNTTTHSETGRDITTGKETSLQLAPGVISDFIYPRIDPVTGLPDPDSFNQWHQQQLQAKAEREAKANRTNSTDGENTAEALQAFDPESIEPMTQPPENQAILDRIYAKYGIKIVQPVDTTKVPYLEQHTAKNQIMYTDLVKEIEKAFDSLPVENYAKSPDTGKKLFADYIFVNFSPGNCTCGGYVNGPNVGWEKGAYIAMVLQAEVEMGRVIPRDPYRPTFAAVNRFIFAHETSHAINDYPPVGLEPLFDEFNYATGLYPDPTSPSGWSRLYPEEALLLEAGMEPWHRTAYEAIANIFGVLVADKTNLPEFGPRTQHFISTHPFFDGWDYLWSDPANAAIRDKARASLPPGATRTAVPTRTPTNTPTATPTVHRWRTRTPMPTETEEPYVTSTPRTPGEKTPTPSYYLDYSIFLPIAHSGKKAEVTPEPDHRPLSVATPSHKPDSIKTIDRERNAMNRQRLNTTVYSTKGKGRR